MNEDDYQREFLGFKLQIEMISAAAYIAISVDKSEHIFLNFMRKRSFQSASPARDMT